MSFEIPEPYVWDESFKVFYELLDEEHKGLFKGIFDVAKSPDAGGKLQDLKDIVSKHFADEEDMMAKASYPDLGSHKELHVDFLAKLKEVSAPVPTATVDFAKDWLVNHIKGIDHKYINKL
uniref:Hemerythrin n=1 Tax=Clymenella torquata TaxID=292503 RepID=A0A1S6QCG9_CLYTO|nr:hemerythrin [Clymenella torquata]